MKHIYLDASAWTTPEDFYSALLPELGAPEWHGHNLNALGDSLYGGINEIQPPFRVLLTGVVDITQYVKAFLGDVVEVFAAARSRYGADVKLELA